MKVTTIPSRLAGTAATAAAGLPATSRRTRILTLVALAVLATGYLLLPSWLGGSWLEAAAACDYRSVTVTDHISVEWVSRSWDQLDDPDTLSGDEDNYAGAMCVLDATRAPGWVYSAVDNTRAIDGVQTAEWRGLTARWTYHPDHGLDMTISD
jgi:hypothetical protein